MTRSVAQGTVLGLSLALVWPVISLALVCLVAVLVGIARTP